VFVIESRAHGKDFTRKIATVHLSSFERQVLTTNHVSERQIQNANLMSEHNSSV
jgi:hypothetical protein